MMEPVGGAFLVQDLPIKRISSNQMAQILRLDTNIEEDDK